MKTVPVLASPALTAPRRGCPARLVRRTSALALALTVALAAAPAFAQTAPMNPAGGQPGGPPITPKAGGPLTPSDITYKRDAIELYVVPGQFVEYKFQLKAGGTMIFNWKADGPLDVDFHTVPEGKPISASETFMRGVASSGQGTYKAPYAGLHGWYWKNSGSKPVKVVITAAGFFNEARMFSGDPVGEPMEVQDPEPPPTY